MRLVFHPSKFRPPPTWLAGYGPEPSSTIPITAAPQEMVSMRGDGSCLFRSFSYLLTGAQSDHRIVRQAVVEYITTNTRIFSDLANCDDYPSTSFMALPGEWGTEVEVLAFASMTNTTVNVYTPVARMDKETVYKWMPYKPVEGTVPKVQVSASGCMYISNIDSHFQPVIKVKA